MYGVDGGDNIIASFIVKARGEEVGKKKSKKCQNRFHLEPPEPQ